LQRLVVAFSNSFDGRLQLQLYTAARQTTGWLLSDPSSSSPYVVTDSSARVAWNNVIASE
jgi:hypothetical protein